MEQLPFAVESPERTSQLLPASTADDGSSLVTTSSQGSFLGSSSGTGGFATTATTTTTTTTATTAMQVPTHHPATPHVNANTRQSQQQQHQQPGRPAPVPPMVTPSLPPAAAAPVPTSRPSSSGGLTSGLNFFGALRAVPSVLTSSKPKPQPSPPKQQQHTETIDFTYVNVCEIDADEVDITLDGQHTAMEGLQGTIGVDNETLQVQQRGDILTLLLSGGIAPLENNNEDLVCQCEEANQAATEAMEAKREGDLQGALKAHSHAAKKFRDAAVLVKDRNEPMANSLLLLSQTQAKSALALKRIVKQQPIPHDSNAAKNPRSKIITQKDRLRAAVRGALVTRNEEEMSDSAFLGKATKGPVAATTAIDNTVTRSAASTLPSHSNVGNVQHNPVDDMMELERELRDMDMALELGNSIASLDTRTQSRLKNSIGVDGSFMVVPPGSQSYMSSSNMWSPSSANTNQRANNKQSSTRAAPTASVRQRANRVQNLANPHPRSPSHGLQQQQTQYQPQQTARNAAAPAASGLDASWWGNSSTTSQVLASSVISLGASSMRGPQEVSGGHHATDPNASPANTKQLMRLMDALKTLGDENANLLREVEEAEAARMEAKAAKEQMAKFKSEYAKRFENLKAALEKFRKAHPEHGPVGPNSSNEPNPVTNSEFMRSASTTEQLQRQDQLIRKLTADLKKEKEESKKKDQALRKYESFYREVKARSAQKAAQRQREAAGQRPPQPQSHAGSRRSGHR